MEIVSAQSRNRNSARSLSPNGGTLARQPYTRSEREVLEFIRQHVLENGTPPTQRQITKETGHDGKYFVKKLREKGSVETYGQRHRGLRILDPDYATEVASPLVGEVMLMDEVCGVVAGTYLLKVDAHNLRNGELKRGDLLVVSPVKGKPVLLANSEPMRVEGKVECVVRKYNADARRNHPSNMGLRILPESLR